jgi:hypothetical protein
LSTLSDWLNKNTKVRDSIKWVAPNRKTYSYKDWNEVETNQLDQMYTEIASKGSYQTPELFFNYNPHGMPYLLSRDDAWTLFLVYIAQSLAVEISGKTKWSLTKYPQDWLDNLLSSAEVYSVNDKGMYIILHEINGYITPGNPYFPYTLLQAEEMIGTSKSNTTAKLLEWCRQNLRHHTGGMTEENVKKTWQCNCYPPLTRMIFGTYDERYPDTLRHYTAGCHGTAGFLRWVLRTVNIPVKVLYWGDHRQVYFMSDYLYLSHGDDPYDQLVSTAGYPVDSIFVGLKEYKQVFSGPETEKFIGFKPKQLAVRHLPLYILKEHLEDIKEKRTHENSKVYETFHKIYTVADLEKERLWERMDQKILAYGGQIPETDDYLWDSWPRIAANTNLIKRSKLEKDFLKKKVTFQKLDPDKLKLKPLDSKIPQNKG